ncbi:MAG: ABC transporter permease [Clostridia bacterium]|nr:ABC transporter permease [Clostridia bacterium]
MQAILASLISFLPRAIMQGTPLLYGATGEIITEKSGHLNLGIPGIMYVGGISGAAGAFLYEHSVDVMNPALAILIPLSCALVGSLLMGLIYSFLTVTLRANQNVTGLALTTFGIGIGNFFGGTLAKLSGTGETSLSLPQTKILFKTSLPFAADLGWFGSVFLSHGFLVYLAVVIALIAAFVLGRTRVGLQLRAVGENPATADAAGVNVNRYKYVATCIGSMIAGLGGLYYVVDYMGVWANDGFGDRGWLAIALVIFAVWRPHVGILGSYLFGGLYILYTVINIGVAEQELFKMLPYVVTIIVLVVTSIREKRESQPPASLGLAYFREER